MRTLIMVAWKIVLAVAGGVWFVAVVSWESQLGSVCGPVNEALYRWHHVTIPAMLWCGLPAVVVAIIEPRRPLANAALFLTPTWTCMALVVLLVPGLGRFELLQVVRGLFHWYAPLAIFVVAAWCRRIALRGR